MFNTKSKWMQPLLILSTATLLIVVLMPVFERT